MSAPVTVKLTHKQILVVFSGLVLGMLLAALDQTIVATALPRIVSELHGLDHLAWVVTAYLLTSTASTPLYGKISDLYGRKIVFQTAIVIFLIGSMLAGLAQNMTMLIAFRAVQGLGAGGLIALAMAIIGDIVSPRERGRYQGYLGAVFALASIGGPLLGGFFVDNLTWRWIFYVNVPIGAVALFVTTIALDLPFRRVDHAIDYVGAGLLVGSVTSALLVMVWGGSEYAWASVPIIGLGATAVVLFSLFIVQERRAAEPILPLRLFRNSIFSVTSAVAFIVGTAMFGAIIFVPLFLQVVNGATPTRSGLLLTPLMLGLISATIVSGRLITRTGRYKVFPVLGTAILALGTFLLSRMDAHTGRMTSTLNMVVTGIGIGLVMQVLVLAVQNAVEHRDLGIATSASSFFRSMGGAFGVAVFGSVLTSRLAYHLPRALASAGPAASNFDKSVLQDTTRIQQLDPLLKAPVIDAFARSLHAVFLWAIPFAVLAFVLSWLLKELPLRETVHVGGVAEAVGEDLAVSFETAADPQGAPELVGNGERTRTTEAART